MIIHVLPVSRLSYYMYSVLRSNQKRFFLIVKVEFLRPQKWVSQIFKDMFHTLDDVLRLCIYETNSK